MENKTKDCVFSLFLILFGGFVVYEGLAMVERASRPPHNITTFSISPGMLPTVLGAALIVFSLVLFVNTLRGGGGPFPTLIRHLRSAWKHFHLAIREPDVHKMFVGVVILAIYTFVILGRMSFWSGSLVFLIGLMLFLRATKFWIIAVTSVASVFSIILLFVTVFKTILP